MHGYDKPELRHQVSLEYEPRDGGGSKWRAMFEFGDKLENNFVEYGDTELEAALNLATSVGRRYQEYRHAVRSAW